MRKLVFMMLAAVMGLTAFSSSSFAATPIKIFVLNKQIQTDAAPILEQGAVLVPIRAVAEALLADVAWDPKLSTVTIRKWSETIILTVGQKSGVLQGKSDSSATISLSVPVKKVNNSVYVPLRFVSEQFGYQVAWKDRAVYINSPLPAEIQATLHEGTLEASRELLINKIIHQADIHYNEQPLNATYEGEHMTWTFLFPEGEALRFYLIRDGIISLIEIQDDFLVATWQAYIAQGDGLQPFAEKKFSDEKGVNPSIEKNFYFYSSGGFGDSNHQSSGQIEQNGQITVMGHKSSAGGTVYQEVGTIGLKLADEVRKEHDKEKAKE
jgi:hypothetical protein